MKSLEVRHRAETEFMPAQLNALQVSNDTSNFTGKHKSNNWKPCTGQRPEVMLREVRVKPLNRSIQVRSRQFTHEA